LIQNQNPGFRARAFGYDDLWVCEAASTWLEPVFHALEIEDEMTSITCNEDS